MGDHWDYPKRKRQVEIHEAGIAANIIEIAQKTAEEHNLKAIRQIEIEIGDISGVQIDALEFALDALKSGTILENSVFSFLQVPILLFCRDCENEYAADIDDLICPGCMHANFNVMQGKEMVVKAIHGEK